jgi:serine phosphatase RsbU (regulator of sigma subunit)
MEIQIAVAKIQKYARSDSGDTVEIVERPNGGVSVVLADGQTSGKGAKSISNLVVRKVISLLAEGVRDGAAARAASDSLFTERQGKVSATLNILSVDQQTKTLVFTRNNPAPALFVRGGKIEVLNEHSLPIGIYRATRPVITEISLEPNITAVVFSDGLIHAGDRMGKPMDIGTILRELLLEQHELPQQIADLLLKQALILDEDRPVDDVSVVVLSILPFIGDKTRRMTVRWPVES